MAKMKTSELIDQALDWAVAKCLGQPDEWMADHKRGYINSPSTDWSQGGPIIEREGIRLHRGVSGMWWAATEEDPARPIPGPTPLTAAMRCFVASKLGDEVNVPEELQ